MLKKVIIDTNILQYGISPQFSQQVIDLFEDLKNKDVEILISSYTYYEIYKGIQNKKIEQTKKLVDLFESVTPNKVLYKFAALLCTFYKNYPTTKNFASQYSDGDTIIGATAILERATIITANGNDFPKPFFVEVDRLDLININKNGLIIPVSILNPEYKYFIQCMDEYYPKS